MTDSTAAQKVLVINCGSSSIKSALYANAEAHQPELTALAEQLGTPEARLLIHQQPALAIDAPHDHEAALRALLQQLSTQLPSIVGVGHRVVHGGERFSASTVIDDATLSQLEQVSGLAPLHNPVNLLGIHTLRQLLPQVPQVAVFDTAFHQSLHPAAYLYGVPYDWYQQDGVRRYGFHGTSYRYVSQTAAQQLNKPLSECRLLIAHLGNGCSACAIDGGQSVDTTMGLTPLEGLVMGSRSGDVDAGIFDYMARSRNLSAADIVHELNKNSGLKGLSNDLSNDMRTLLEAEANGNEDAQRAIDVFCFRAARQLAALHASLPALDALVFTGGIGEHAAAIRQRIVSAWRSLPFALDPKLNASHGDATGRISQPDSPLVMVIATNEERMIAADTYECIA
ncbi:acetate kinase [Bacterioplanes sanyensis]|uniref:acetate/propionate family kinase n=1 Tax=Bacterioplanes sanyensis TaxID=1249553 RepID=UPI001679F744|nr:acetate kinase [Bacterioplanes sanyensis]GGY33172.1 acetate kinase [Bacterioplanes sanyensis]